MTSSVFEVQSSFNIEDNATAALNAIADVFERVGAAADGTSEAFGKIAEFRFDGLAASANAAGEAMDGLGRAASEAGDAAAAGAAGTATAAAANDELAASAVRAAQAHIDMAEAMGRSNPGERGASRALTYDEPFNEPAREPMRLLSAPGGSGGGSGGGSAGNSPDEAEPAPRRPGRPVADDMPAAPSSRARAGSSGHGGWHPFNLPELAVEGTVGYGIEQAARTEGAIKQALLNQGDRTGAQDDGSAGFQRVSDTLFNARVGTAGSLTAAAEAYAPVSGETAGRMSSAQLDTLFPLAFKAGELAKLTGGENVTTATKNFVDFADMTGARDAATAGHAIDMGSQLTAFAAMPSSAVQTMGRYSLPVARAMGMTTDEYMRQVSIPLQTSRSASSTGTGFSAAYMELLTNQAGDDNLASHHRRMSAQASLRHALHGDPEGEATLHELDHENLKDKNKHRVAFEELGLYNNQGKPTYLKSDGSVDSDDVTSTLRGYYATHNHEQFAKVMSEGFGTRGSREMMPNAMATDVQMQAVGTHVVGGATVQQRQAALATGADQQMQQAGASLSTMLNTISTAALPEFKTALHGLSVVMDGIADFAHDHKNLTGEIATGAVAVAGTAAALAVGGSVVGGIAGMADSRGIRAGARAGRAAPYKWLGKGLRGVLGAGEDTAMAGAEEAAFGEVLGAEMLGGPLGWIAAGATGVGIAGYEAYEHRGAIENALGFHNKPAATNSANNLLRMSNPANQAANVNTNVGGITVNVAGGTTAQQIVDSAMKALQPQMLQAVSNALAHSLQTSGGFAGGSMSSPYSIGYGGH